MVEPSIKIRISCFSFFRISHRVQTQQICGILFHCRKTWFVFEYNSMGMWINIYIYNWLLNMMGMSMKHTMSNQKKRCLSPPSSGEKLDELETTVISPTNLWALPDLPVPPKYRP